MNLRRIGRHATHMQAVVDQDIAAKMYHSDTFLIYNQLTYYPGRHTVSEGKTDTYSVEGDNAELRHYLARLARKSRCFSRCPYALCCALILFVFAFNSRQLYKQRYPNYPAHIFQFVTS
jgi:IS1 family transposase